MASAITFISLDYSGTPSADDILGARRAIALENQRRASLVPPGTPLPFANNTQVKASVLAIYLQSVTNEHADNIASAKTQGALSEHFTPAQLEQIAINLRTRVNAGESAASVVTDTAS